MSAPGPLLAVEGLRKWFEIRRGIIPRVVANVKAVDDVSFTIARHQVLGLAGESGSGKTTIGRTVLRLIEPTSGVIRFNGTDITSLDNAQLDTLLGVAECKFCGADVPDANLLCIPCADARPLDIDQGWGDYETDINFA